MTNSGWQAIDELANNEDSVRPKMFRDNGVEHNGSSNLKEVAIFPFGNANLLGVQGYIVW